MIPSSTLEVVQDSFDPTNLCQVDRYNKLVHNFLSKLTW